MPGHGEYRHLKAHARLAAAAGVDPANIFISENGRVLEISEKGAKLGAMVPAGRVLVDGLGVGDVGNVVLRDRKHLAQDGLLVVVISLSSEDNSIIAGPDIISRGFSFMKDSDELIEELRRRTVEVIERCNDDRISDWATIKSDIRAEISHYLNQSTKQSPMILPVIMEV